MRRVALAVGLVVAAAAFSVSARAQDASPPPVASTLPAPAPPPATPTSTPAAIPPAGLAVVAIGGATDATWPLAQSVYGTSSLRPARIDEAHARVLCGEAPAPGASQELRDLAESLAAVKGEEAPSRMLLGEIARRLNVRALVVVHVDAGHPIARVFLSDTGAFDAASYGPDTGPTVAWTAAARSLGRAFGSEPSVPQATSAPLLATHEEPTVPARRGKSFYESGWFWGAVGAAAFAAGAIFFATRDNGESTIHLQAEVPH